MTCASRAARVEKELNKLDGVTATVNFATESARVAFPAAVTVGDLISVVEQAGYGAAEPAAPEGEPAGAARPDAADDEATRCGSGCWCAWRWPSRWSCWRWFRRCSSGTGSGWRWRWPRRWRCGGVAIPPRRAGQRPARGRDHGHAGVGGRECRVPVVAVRAQLGILIKGPEVLESTRAIDTIVLDKTGTVTTGRMSLADVASRRRASPAARAPRRRTPPAAASSSCAVRACRSMRSAPGSPRKGPRWAAPPSAASCAMRDSAGCCAARSPRPASARPPPAGTPGSQPPPSISPPCPSAPIPPWPGCC